MLYAIYFNLLCMKDILRQMDKAFDSRVRVAVMSVLLTANDWVDFLTLKQQLGITDGNLASHINTLEVKKFLEVRKRFVDKYPNTSYRITQTGKDAFARYVAALRQLLNIK